MKRKNCFLIVILSLLVAVTAVILFQTLYAHPKVDTDILKGKSVIFVKATYLNGNFSKRIEGPIIYDLWIKKHKKLYLEGYNSQYIHNICGYKGDSFYCSYETDGPCFLMKTEDNKVINKQEFSCLYEIDKTDDGFDPGSIIECMKEYKDGILFMTYERYKHNYKNYTGKTLFYTDFNGETTELLKHIRGYSVSENKIYFYKYAKINTDDLTRLDDNIYCYEDGNITEIFCPR